jgi:hypothetical protein
VDIRVSDIESKWGDFLRALGSKRPDWAGKLRQGEVVSLSGMELTLSFASLFESHRQALDDLEVRREIELILEEQLEAPLRLRLLSADAAHQHQSREDEYGAGDEDALARHGKDKSVITVQKVFSVKIRHVFQDNQQVPYHLGMSCNYKTEE